MLKNFNLKLMISVIVVVFVVLTSFFYVFYATYIVKDVQVFPSDVYIIEGKNAGFNLDPDKIHFGKVSKDFGSANRYINLNNSWDYGVDTYVTVWGELAEHEVVLEYDVGNETVKSKSVYLEPYESKDVKLYLIPSKDSEIGKFYDGTIKFTIKRHKLFG
ncbi:MAG: hypothetical protein KJ896_00540 [Nanoarchaeota archaeon]|nr:hypothetical protein [Nanoarchaeota archaeon]